MAGYTATAGSAVTSFAGTLTIPTLTCPATGTVQVLAGVHLFDVPGGMDSRLEWAAVCFNGTLASVDGSVYLSGTGGVVNSQGIVAAAPGDTLRLKMSENASTVTESVTNITTKAAASISLAIHPAFGQIVATTGFTDYTTGGPPTAIINFTKITFGALKFNAATLATLSPTKVQMYAGSTLRVATSAISASGSFSELFKHA